MEVGAEEPVDRSHEIDGDEAGEEFFKATFHRGVLGEVDKIVDVKANGKGGCGYVRGGVGRIDDVACKHARVGRVLSEADALEDSLDFVVPMARTASETVESFLEEPVFVLCRVWVANRWFDDGDFVIGEDALALAECVLAVALFKGASAFDRHADKQSHRVWAKDGDIFLQLGPDAIFVVAKDDNAGLRPKRVKHFILFDGKDAHGRNGFRDSFSSKGAVFGEADLDVRVL